MLSVDQILADVAASLDRGSGSERARTLGRITTLYVAGAQAFTTEQVELFDIVIQQFSTTVDTGARVELSGRLAVLARAPRGVVRTLAFDEIIVARPVLSGSPELDDQTLMDVALAMGRDHMLAICERPVLSTPVTDVMVTRGDGVVRHAVVGNAGARFSAIGTATLVDFARRDDALGTLMRDRSDLSAQVLRQLVDIGSSSARHRLLASRASAGEGARGRTDRAADAPGASAPDLPRDYAGALNAVEIRLGGRAVTEADIVQFAEAGRRHETLAGLSAVTGLSPASLERIFVERDNDLLIVIGKARGWSWNTVRALLKLRDPGLAERHHFRRAEETFDGLETTTAARVVHFLKVRETAGYSAASGGGERIRI